MNEKEFFDELTRRKNDVPINKIKTSYLYSLIPLVIGIVWFAISFISLSHLQTQQKVLRFDLTKLNDSISINKRLLLSIKYACDSLQSQFFFNHDTTVFKNTIEADISLRKLLKDSSISKDLLIKYFKKTSDQNRVWSACRELGYRNLYAKVTRDTDLAKMKTNAVYFSREVKLIDIKVLTLVLIRAGFGIKTIDRKLRPSLNTIELEGELTSINNGPFMAPNRPNVTVERIMQADSINDIIYR